MKHEARREAILAAVAPVFARNGPHGATTRELAKAAGVSEALLYRHFPSKEAMYQALDETTDAAAMPPAGLELILHMPPGTARLVRCIHFVISQVARETDDTVARLLIQSLANDGAYARAVLSQRHNNLAAVFIESLKAAEEAGDIRKGSDIDTSVFWFTHHIVFSMQLLRIPEPTAAPYGDETADLLDKAISFTLRGIGLKNSAIKKHYRPAAWL